MFGLLMRAAFFVFALNLAGSAASFAGLESGVSGQVALVGTPGTLPRAVSEPTKKVEECKPEWQILQVDKRSETSYIKDTGVKDARYPKGVVWFQDPSGDWRAVPCDSSMEAARQEAERLQKAAKNVNLDDPIEERKKEQKVAGVPTGPAPVPPNLLFAPPANLSEEGLVSGADPFGPGDPKKDLVWERLKKIANPETDIETMAGLPVSREEHPFGGGSVTTIVDKAPKEPEQKADSEDEDSYTPASPTFVPKREDAPPEGKEKEEKNPLAERADEFANKVKRARDWWETNSVNDPKQKTDNKETREFPPWSGGIDPEKTYSGNCPGTLSQSDFNACTTAYTRMQEEASRVAQEAPAQRPAPSPIVAGVIQQKTQEIEAERSHLQQRTDELIARCAQDVQCADFTTTYSAAWEPLKKRWDEYERRLDAFDENVRSYRAGENAKLVSDIGDLKQTGQNVVSKYLHNAEDAARAAASALRKTASETDSWLVWGGAKVGELTAGIAGDVASAGRVIGSDVGALADPEREIGCKLDPVGCVNERASAWATGAGTFVVPAAGRAAGLLERGVARKTGTLAGGPARVEPPLASAAPEVSIAPTARTTREFGGATDVAPVARVADDAVAPTSATPDAAVARIEAAARNVEAEIGTAKTAPSQVAPDPFARFDQAAGNVIRFPEKTIAPARPPLPEPALPAYTREPLISLKSPQASPFEVAAPQVVERLPLPSSGTTLAGEARRWGGGGVIVGTFFTGSLLDFLSPPPEPKPAEELAVKVDTIPMGDLPAGVREQFRTQTQFAPPYSIPEPPAPAPVQEAVSAPLPPPDAVPALTPGSDPSGEPIPRLPGFSSGPAPSDSDFDEKLRERMREIQERVDRAFADYEAQRQEEARRQAEEPAPVATTFNPVLPEPNLEPSVQPLTENQLRERLNSAAEVNRQVHFNHDSAAITEKAIPELDKLGRVLSGPEFRGTTVSIIGHTDAFGGDEYNRILSLRRAEAIRNYLVQNFDIPAALAVEGKGKGSPLPDLSPWAPEQRRVQVIVKKP